MKFKRVAMAALLLCAMALPGCSRLRDVYLVNNSGRVLQVLQSVSHWQDYEGAHHSNVWNASWGWPFLIDQGDGRRMKNASGQLWSLRVRSGRCWSNFETRMIAFYETEGWSDFRASARDVALQLEPDGLLYLVVADTQHQRPRAVEVLPFVAIQPGGFPLAPTSRTCR